MPFTGLRAEVPKEENLFQIVDDGERHICGVIVSVSALLSGFDQTLTTCERLLRDVLHIHRLCDMDRWRYITTATAWALAEENVSLHDEVGRCLAVDPTLDDRGEDWWSRAIGRCSYDQLLPEDRRQTRFFHDEALRGRVNTFRYRARMNDTYLPKTVQFEPCDGLSKRLLRVRHHVHA